MSDGETANVLARLETLISAGKYETASELAQGELARLSATTDPRLLGAMQIAYVRAELGAGRPTADLGRRCREALRNVRGDVLETRVRLAGALLGLQVGEFMADAQDALVWLRERRASLEADELLELIIYESLEARLTGGDPLAVFDGGVAELEGTPQQRRLRLERARAALHLGKGVDELDALVLEVAASSMDSREIGLTEEILWACGEQLANDSIPPLLEWTRERSPHIAGRILAQRGRFDEALALLRAGAEHREGQARSVSMHALLELLDEDAHDERLRYALLLEAELDVKDDPSARHDVAFAMALIAGPRRDPELMERALANARRASAGLQGERPNPGSKLWVSLMSELIQLRAARPTVALAELARQLVCPADAPHQLVAEVRASAAAAMTMVGPLCHPQVFDTALALVGLAEVELEGHRGLPLIEARCRWLQALQRGERTPPGSWAKGKLDDAPDWLIALVLGESASVTPLQVIQVIEQLQRVVYARPDAADHLLAALLHTWELGEGAARKRIESVIRECVEIPSQTGSKVWVELDAAVADALTRSRSPWLRGLYVTVKRGRGEPIELEPEAGDGALGPSERAALLFSQARELSERARDQRGDDREANSARARALWDEVLTIGREQEDSWIIFHSLVGLGNALRWGEPPELEASLRHYAEAEQLGLDNQQGLAKLWKVTADALAERGGDDDLRRAEGLIDRSIGARTDRVRAESLLSASMIAERHPDLDASERLQRSIGRLMDAVRADRQVGEVVVEGLCRRIVQLCQLVPTLDLNSHLDELTRRHPEQRVVIERARQGVGDLPERGLVDSLANAMTDPDARVVGILSGKLKDPDEHIAEIPPNMLAMIGSNLGRFRQSLVENCLLGHPDRLEQELEILRGDASPEGRVGRLVGQVLVLMHLARLGRRDAQEAREATRAARVEMAPLSANTRTYLLMTMAHFWQPFGLRGDTSGFGLDLSGALAREALEVAGGEARAPSDVLGLLARAHRYTTMGDRNAHLRRARDLYARLHQRALDDGDGDTAALSLHHRVDAEMEMGVGDRVERITRALETLQRALRLARMQRRRAEIQTSIAWYRTQLANFVDPGQQRTVLTQALAEFDAVDQSAVPSVSNWANLRAVCAAGLAKLEQGPEAEVAFWEQQLADPQLSPYDRATFEHNLAGSLRRCHPRTAAAVHRALDLYESAATVREPESARHGWETCFDAGTLISQVLYSQFELATELLPWPPAEAIARGCDWLTRAIEAAKQLGYGEELANAALGLAELARLAPRSSQVSTVAEEAWRALRLATPYLILNETTRAHEALIARRIAVRIAELELEGGVLGVAPSGVCALNEGGSELVTRWLLRSQASARRPLNARLVKPTSATTTWWSSWQDTLDISDSVKLGRLLEELHQDDPDYLVGDLDLETTWRWLEDQTGSVALAVVLAQPMTCCVVLRHDETSRRRTHVLCIPTQLPPGDEDQYIEQMKGMIRGEPAALSIHDSMISWVRRTIIDPVLLFLRTPPLAVLWCPGWLVRLVTPAVLWSGVPVASTHMLALRDTGKQVRPRSTLVSAAFPTGDRIGKKAPAAVGELVQSAKDMGPVRTLVSAGSRYGKRFRPLDARDTPASAADLLAEAPNHDLICILAHGSAGANERAALLCVNAKGERDRLTGRELARHLDAFAGATVLLLACSSGRVGGQLHEPDGIAGALLSAGARAVIAPLWSVFLPVAVRVGRDVLTEIERGRSLWEILAELPATVLADGPVLDDVTPETRAEGLHVQKVSFVVWVG